METTMIKVHCKKCGFVDAYEPTESGASYYEVIGTCPGCKVPMFDGDGNETARLVEFIVEPAQPTPRSVTINDVRCQRCHMNASLDKDGLCSFCNREPYAPEPISGFPYWRGFMALAAVGALFIAAVYFLGR